MSNSYLADLSRLARLRDCALHHHNAKMRECARNVPAAMEKARAL